MLTLNWNWVVNITGICSSANTLNLFSTGNGGTGILSYNWTGPNGFTSTAQNPSIPNVTTAASGTYTVTLTDVNGCSDTKNVLVTVNPILIPSVTIGVNPGNNICSGTSITFTATPVNGGSNPIYQWKINGVNTGINSPTFTTSSLANTDKVTVVLTSDATCPSLTNVTSNVITMTVNDTVIPSVSISSSATIICPGNSINFSAVPINGGSTPSYQWMINGFNAGNNSPNFSTSLLVNGDIVTVKLTSNAACASPITISSNPIIITVNAATPPTPGLITGTTPVCPGITGLTYSITPVANATTYTWTVPTGWSINAGLGTNSITVTSGSTGQNGTISVTAGNNCGTSSASTLAVTVSPTSPATPGIITGTPTQCPALSGQIYSIATVTNATSYNWTIPTGWSITSGAGTNSIIVTSGNSGQNGTISVTAENSCGISSSRTLAVTINPTTPGTPGIITGIVTQCPALTAQTYSVAAVTNATTYTWTVPSGWSITSGTGTNSITVTSGNTGQNGNITVTAGNSCGTSSANTLAVTVSPATPATPAPITGTSSVCPGITGLTYSITAVTNATTYNWTVPTGWSITAGTGTNSIIATSGSTGQNGNISVTAENSCGTSSSRTLAVTVNPVTPATPGAITGTVTQCPALTGQIYSIVGVANATTYNWTVPTGWLITSGVGTNSISVTSGSAGQNGNISVTAGNSCGTSAANSLAVTISPATPTTPGTITGTSPVCPNITGLTYSIVAVANATTYTWTVPSGWLITSGAGTNSITVTSGAAGQNGNISVTAGNSCGTSAAKTLAVTVSPATPATPGAINGLTEQCINKTGLVYSVTVVPNATSYVWTLPSGWSITAGVNTNSITVSTSGTAVGGNITVTATNSCGISGAQTFAVTVNTGIPIAPAVPTSPQSTSICPVVSGLQYNVPAVVNATNYTWALPIGWIITAGSGTNSITVTASSTAVSGNISVKANNACGSSASSTNLPVTVGNFAFVDAGVDKTVCATSPDVSLLPTTGGATGNNNVTWSSSNGGTFSPNANKWNATYTPGATAIAAGTVTLTITSDDPSGTCGAASDQMVVTIRPTPIATISGTTTLCSGLSTSITFTATPNTTITYKIGSGANQTISIDGTGIGTVNTGTLTTNTTYNLISVDYTTAPSCTQTISGSATITVNPPAIANANIDQTVCASSPNIILSGAVSGAATTATWSGGAGTFNPNNTTLNATYTPTPSEITAGTVTLTLTTNDPAGPCPSVSDQMVITINPSVVANANVDQTICASSPNVILAGVVSGAATSGIWTGGAGIFSPNNTTLNASYTPTASEINAGTVTLTLTTNDPAGPCPSVSDQMVITINPSAVTNANVDQTVCASSPNVILAGAVSGTATSGTWTGGAGIFSPNNTTLNASYTPTASEINAGTVTLTLTTNDPAGPCPSASDQIVITINPLAVANANVDQTVCASSPNVILAGAVNGTVTTATWSGGAGTFNPNNTTLNATYTPTPSEINAGTVTLTLTTNDPAGPCPSASDQMVITINPSAVANANVDQTVCAYSPNVILAGTVSGAATTATWSGGAGTFNPNNTTLNATYTPTPAEINAGTVTLTLTTNDPAGPCPIASDQMLITINPSAVANANVDQTVCASSPNVILAGAVSGSATSGTWSGGAGTFSPNNATLNATYTPTASEITTGTVTLTLTTNDPAGPCLTASDQMVITINPSATISAGVSLTICSNTTATMAGSFGGSATSATWSTSGSGTFNNNTPTAIYTPSATDISAGTVTLTYTTNDPIGPCPSVNATIILTIKKAVVITTQPSNTSICASFPVNLSVVAIGDGLTYQWFKGSAPSGTPVANSTNISGAQSTNLHFNQANLTDDGNYYVIISGASPCASVTSAQRTLNVDQAIIVSTQPVSQAICTGSNVTFTVVADANGDPLSFQWRKNGINIGGASSTTTSSTLTINNVISADAANYDVLISGPAGYTCSSVQSAIASLTINPLPTISGTLNVCEGATTQLSGSASPAAVNPWISSNTSVASVSNTGLVTGVTSGTTVLTYTNSNGCKTTATVLVNTTPNAVATNATQTICSLGTIATIVLSGNVAATTFNWTRNNTAAVTGIAVSGNGNISGSLTNTTSVPVSVTFTITPVANGCSGVPITAMILVNPTPDAVASPVSQTICSASAITTIALSGSVASTVFNWSRDNTATVTGIAASGSGNISGNLTNTTNAPVTVTFTITPTANGCQGTPIIATIIVKPKPNAVATNSGQTICSGNTIATMALSGNVTATTFNWTRDNSIAVTGIPASGNGNISGTLTNITNATVTVTFTITPTANGCPGAPITATVIIEAASIGGAVTVSQPNILPAVKIVTVCHSASGTIYLSGYTGSIVRWESSTTGGASWASIINSGTTYNYTNILATTLFRAVVQNASCTQTYSTASIINVIPNIKPSPVSATPSTICNGDSTILSSQSGYATSQNLATGGAFDNSNPTGWLVDGCGNCLNAGSSNTNPNPFQLSATNGGTYSGINYTSVGKFAIANGNFNSVLQTPVFSTLGLSSASLSFDHAYFLTAGASAKVEISIDGGTSYNTILAQYNGVSSQGPYTISTNMSIDLSAYLGQTNLKIRFNYQGTVGSSWAIDNIKIPEAPVGVLTSQWIDTNTNTVISNSNSTNATVSPSVTTTYAVTSFLNGCTSFGPNGTTYVTVTVNQRPTANIGANQTICYDGTATFSVALTGSAPWSVTYSDGTTPITVNNINVNPFVFTVSNITTNKTYTITALSDSQCTAKPIDLTGSATVTVLNGTAGLWTGLVSTDWFDCKNWAGGLPSSSINAQIPTAPSGGPRMPIIDPASSPFAAAYSNIASAQDLIIASGASVTMASIGISNLQISRDWKNSGSFIPGIGTVTFNGGTANQVQTVNLGIKTNETFYNLTTNNSGTAKGINLVDNFELTVSNTLYLLSGDIRLTGEAQLIQAGSGANPVGGSGKLLRDQQGQKNSFNYNYWSSPVSLNNTNYSISGVLRDGTDVTTNPFSPVTINFGDGAYFADGVGTNPIKISNRWLFAYNSLTPDSNTDLENYYQWNAIGNTGLLKLGEGFTMKGTDGTASLLSTQNYVFVGKPNSGTISLNIGFDQTYLIGNPYPSSLDADEFIKDNLKDCGGCRASANIFSGALYFWDHFGLTSNHFLAEYVGGYGTYTLMGGLVAIADDPLNVNNGATGTKTPKRYIPVAQGFFVDASLDSSLSGTATTVQGGTLNFKNSQRAFIKESSGNSIFMKQSAPKKAVIEQIDSRPKIRLSFISAIGINRQLLVGVDSNTTNDFDIGYDAPMLEIEGDNIYWEFSNSKFVIQGVPDFNEDQIIPIGLTIANEGLTTIKIDVLENIPQTTEIYLYDTISGSYHNIKNSGFTISLAPGEYSNRFSLRFTNKTLSIQENTINDGIQVLYANNYKVLIVQNKVLDTTVKEVYLFNVLGQYLTKWNVENMEQSKIQIPIKNLSSGVYIVKLKTTKGDYSKKIIIK